MIASTDRPGISLTSDRPGWGSDARTPPSGTWLGSPESRTCSATRTLTKWIGAVDADLPALRSFTAGLHRDLAAVVAGLTLHCNSGAVEGTVNRVNQLKAAMYGRAKPDLLRKLILLA